MEKTYYLQGGGDNARRVYRKTALQGILCVDAARFLAILPVFLAASTFGVRCGGDFV